MKISELDALELFRRINVLLIEAREKLNTRLRIGDEIEQLIAIYMHSEEINSKFKSNADRLKNSKANYTEGIKLAMSLKANNLSYSQIAKRLNELGYTTTIGRKWKGQNLRNTIKYYEKKLGEDI